jgi:hypothetical protein
MRRTLLILATLTCALSAVAGPAWKVYRFEEGRFSVELPDEPAKSKQDLRAAVTNNSFTVKTDSGFYMVSYVDSPTFGERPTNVSAILDRSVRGAASNVGAPTIRLEARQRNGFVGREVWFTGRDGTDYHGLVFLANERLYQVYASGSQAWVDGKDAIRFLNSFKMWR